MDNVFPLLASAPRARADNFRRHPAIPPPTLPPPLFPAPAGPATHARPHDVSRHRRCRRHTQGHPHPHRRHSHPHPMPITIAIVLVISIIIIIGIVVEEIIVLGIAPKDWPPNSGVAP